MGVEGLYEEGYTPPKQCAIVDIAYNLIYADRLQLSCTPDYKKDLKKYFLWKAACQSTKCPPFIEKECSMLVRNEVSCSLCAYELDNPENSCARELDAGTTYVSFLN